VRGNLGESDCEKKDVEKSGDIDGKRTCVKLFCIANLVEAIQAERSYRWRVKAQKG